MPLRDSEIAVVEGAILNPPISFQSAGLVRADINSVIGSGVFGDEEFREDIAKASAVTEGGGLEGIERGARTTQLALRLTGIVASSNDGLGSAVIAANNREQVYAVGDSLPAAGKVLLAKVMPEQVVIDNNGTYELIPLYESATIRGIEILADSDGRPKSPHASAASDSEAQGVTDIERAELARRFRQNLYDNPGTLANAVSVAPVRGEGGIVGYRLTPGADREAFDLFGFQSGDIVVAVNGLPLSDSSSALKLYQTMKDATEVSFELDRDGSTVAVNVSLGEP